MKKLYCDNCENEIKRYENFYFIDSDKVCFNCMRDDYGHLANPSIIEKYGVFEVVEGEE
jgi:hypothetical protein